MVYSSKETAKSYEALFLEVGGDRVGWMEYFCYNYTKDACKMNLGNLLCQDLRYEQHHALLFKLLKDGPCVKIIT